MEADSPKLNLGHLPPAKAAAIELLMDFDNAMGRLDYPFFVQKVLGHDFPEIHDPTVQTRLKNTGEIFKNWVMTRHKQKLARKVMFVNPRGTCKSAGTTIPLIPYAHLWDTEIAAMIMSASFEKMGVKFASTVRQVWNGESPTSRLVDLYGDFEPQNKRSRPWSSDTMVTARREQMAHADPTLAAYSILQGPTSGHFKLGILDDPVTQELMERDSQWLAKVWDAYLAMKFVLDNDALMVLIMTRYDEADLIGRIIKEEIEPLVLAKFGSIPNDFDYNKGWIKYAHLAGWEVFYDSVYEDYNADKRVGKVVYPVIWPVERINDVRQTFRGEGMFWKQLMNEPAAREDNPLKPEDIERLYVDTLEQIPQRALRTIDIHCDFAFKDADAYEKQRGDWGVMHVCAKDRGYVYRLAGYRGKDTQAAFGQQLLKLVEFVVFTLKSKVRYITYEASAGHGSGDESTRLWLHQLFMSKPDLPRATAYPIRRHKGANKSKLQRILDTNWAWQEGYVILLREAENNYPLVYQMLHQGYTQYDDDADAMADAFHEELYKKTAGSDLPADIEKYMPGATRNWSPIPLVHGHVARDGSFVAERRTARNPGGSGKQSLFNSILGRR